MVLRDPTRVAANNNGLYEYALQTPDRVFGIEHMQWGSRTVRSLDDEPERFFSITNMVQQEPTNIVQTLYVRSGPDGSRRVTGCTENGFCFSDVRRGCAGPRVAFPGIAAGGSYDSPVVRLGPSELSPDSYPSYL